MRGPVRIGTIGAGSLGFHHIRIRRDLPGVVFVGFVETRADRAAKVASELGVSAVESVAALVERVDALTIVVPTPAPGSRGAQVKTHIHPDNMAD